MCLYLWLFFTSTVTCLHHFSPPPLDLSLSPSACMVAGQLSGELSFPGEPTWDDMPWRRRGGRWGKHTLSLSSSQIESCPLVILHLLPFPFSCVPLPALPSSCPQGEVVVWHRGCCSGRLPNCCWSQMVKVGERDIVLESTSPLVPTAVSQQM